MTKRKRIQIRPLAIVLCLTAALTFVSTVSANSVDQMPSLGYSVHHFITVKAPPGVSSSTYAFDGYGRSLQADAGDAAFQAKLDAFVGDSYPFAVKPPLDLYVLAGQSNMTGAVVDFGPETPTPNVFDVSLGVPRPAVDPLGGQAFAGPGITIGAELHRLYPDARIGLVQCAVGGTSMSRWAPGGDMYATCLQRIAAARAYGRVRGVFFYQGEQDAFDSTAAGWAEKFASMVGGVRQATASPLLPFVFAQLGRRPSVNAAPGWEAVQAEQAAVSTPGVRMIVTRDIPSDLHYTADGYATLGARFADALFSMSPRELYFLLNPLGRVG